MVEGCASEEARNEGRSPSRCWKPGVDLRLRRKAHVCAECSCRGLQAPERAALGQSEDGKCMAMVIVKAQAHREWAISSNAIYVTPEVEKK